MVCLGLPDPDGLLSGVCDGWGCSSAGRAPALQAGGQRFDPAQLHQICPRGESLRTARRTIGDGLWPVFGGLLLTVNEISFEEIKVLHRLLGLMRVLHTL